MVQTDLGRISELAASPAPREQLPEAPGTWEAAPAAPETSPPPPAHHTEGTVEGIFLPSNERPYRWEGWKKRTKDNSCWFNAKKSEDGC